MVNQENAWIIIKGIGAVIFEWKTYLCVLEVVPPEGSDLVLATNVPYCETNILVFYSFHVETCEDKDKVLINKSPSSLNVPHLQTQRSCGRE